MSPVAGPRGKRPLSMIVAMIACSGAGIAFADRIDYERDIQPVFDEHCVVCHQTGSENAGLNLESGKSLEAIRRMPSTETAMALVEPGDPMRSYLLHKVAGTHVQAGGSGGRMPLGGPELTPGQIALIAAWISSERPE